MSELETDKAAHRESQKKVATPVRAQKPPPSLALALPSPPSHNPAELKRMRSKQPDPDKDRVIQELRKAGYFNLALFYRPFFFN